MIKLWAFKRVESFSSKHASKTYYFRMIAEEFIDAYDHARAHYPNDAIYAISKIEYLNHAPSSRTLSEQIQRDTDANFIQG